MSGQLDIHGGVQPVTWDGEPVYSPETVAEGLFDGGAFEQMEGQIALGDCEECGEFGVDTNVKGADRRSVCDRCRDEAL